MLDIVTFLDRAPRPVRQLAYRVAAGRGVLGRLADKVRYRFSSGDIPELPQRKHAAVRLFIGPANASGQAYQWARSAERHLTGVVSIAMHGIAADPYMPHVDLRVPVAVYQRSARWHESLELYLSEQTHVIWESALPMLGRRYGSDTSIEMKRLHDRGVECALFFHGSDIRPPYLHAEQNQWSPFLNASGPVRALANTAAHNESLAAQSGVQVFVSTPDLLQWLPDSTWCPVVVDPSEWQAAATASTKRTSETLVVAHAPTQRWMKGTDRIEPMLRRLSEEGVIEYRQIVGVPHASMPAFYAEADIVLDQFTVGSYGVAACEAMASGRLVMGHIDDDTRRKVREQTGLELPIHEATIESLEMELRRAAQSPRSSDYLRLAGPGFVEAVHDGRRSAAALGPFLGLSA
jgi:hypothetical protein